MNNQEILQKIVAYIEAIMVDKSIVTDLMSCHQTAHTNCHQIA